MKKNILIGILLALVLMLGAALGVVTGKSAAQDHMEKVYLRVACNNIEEFEKQLLHSAKHEFGDIKRMLKDEITQAEFENTIVGEFTAKCSSL